MSNFYKKLILALCAISLISIQAKAEWFIDSLSVSFEEDLLTEAPFAIGPDGTYHVVFKRQLPGGWIGNGPCEAYYLSKAPGGEWSVPQKVSQDDTDIDHPSIAVTPDGGVFISFRQEVEVEFEFVQTMIVAEKAEDSWIYHEIPLEGKRNGNTYLSSDENGNLHLVWNSMDFDFNTLVAYAHNISGTWEVQQITGTDNNNWEGPKIALAEDGTANILFINVNDQLCYASNDSAGGSTWSTLILETGKTYNEYAQIIYHQGEIHVLAAGYNEWSDPNHFFYLKKSGDIWSEALQITTTYEGMPHSMTVDPSGKVIVAGTSYDQNGELFLIEIEQDNIVEYAFAETADKVILDAHVGIDSYDNLFVLYNEEVEIKVSDILMAHQGTPSFAVSFELTDDYGNSITEATITLGETTNTTGDYMFPETEAGSYSYSIEAEGFYTVQSEVDVTEDMLIQITMIEKTFTITFDVEDEQGNSITGATITLDEITNPAGDYMFANILAGTYSYSIEAEGFYPIQSEVEVTEDMIIDVLLYEEKFKLIFDITDESGNPVEDAIVTLNGDSNETGDYVFEDLPAGTYDYSVSKEGFFTTEDNISVQEDEQLVEVVLETDDTSVAEQSDIEVLVFPNPAKDQIFVQADEQIKMILILDMTGREITRVVSETNNTSLSLTGINSGIYLVQIHTLQGILTQKIQITN